MLDSTQIIIIFVFALIALEIRYILPERRKHWALPLIVLAGGLYFGTIHALIPKDDEKPKIAFPRLPQSDILIDIVDVVGVKDEVQIIIYNGNCVDRIQMKREGLKDKDAINKALDKILDLREATGGC